MQPERFRQTVVIRAGEADKTVKAAMCPMRCRPTTRTAAEKILPSSYPRKRRAGRDSLSGRRCPADGEINRAIGRQATNREVKFFNEKRKPLKSL
ncbi:MAG: hypothetical protein U0V48_05500 [Anaerolineales bacterium]